MKLAMLHYYTPNIREKCTYWYKVAKAGCSLCKSVSVTVMTYGPVIAIDVIVTR